ncbi:hypothetical protein [Nocardia sp. R6R-6]
MTKIAGWAAYDQEKHGRAQRYSIQALRLACALVVILVWVRRFWRR